MSTATKGTMLRLVMPIGSSQRILTSLGSTAKVETKEITLTAGRLTTDDIVRYIKEYSRFRDEIVHSLRQLGVQRNPNSTGQSPEQFGKLISDAQKELTEKKAAFQELQTKIDSLQRQIQQTGKNARMLEEVARAGFTASELLTGGGEFKIILGRLPGRKLPDAQRAIQNTFEDQAALAIGTRSKDWAHILLAIPPGKANGALQTLILYDFVQTDIPSKEDADATKSLDDLESRGKKLQAELESSNEQMKLLHEKAGQSLNSLTDQIQDALITLRATMRIGEGSKASQTYAWLAKPPPPKTLNTLQSLGVIYETD